jgi:hypothetical protein
MRESSFVEYESQIDYHHFTKMLRATMLQLEYRANLGGFFWAIIYQLRWILFWAWARKVRPRLYTVEYDNQIIAGIMLGPSGEIGQPVLCTDPSLQKIATKYLTGWVDRLLLDRSRFYYFRTSSLNSSIIRAGQRRHFVLAPNVQYVITLPLGFFTISWISQDRPRFLRRFLRTDTLLQYERRPI